MVSRMINVDGEIRLNDVYGYIEIDRDCPIEKLSLCESFCQFAVLGSLGQMFVATRQLSRSTEY